MESSVSSERDTGSKKQLDSLASPKQAQMKDGAKTNLHTQPPNLTDSTWDLPLHSYKQEKIVGGSTQMTAQMS